MKKRIPDTRVREAIAEWGGNVKAAAGALGIARKNLYQRLATLSLSPDEYRVAAPVAAPATRSVQARRPRSALPPRVARSFHLCADLIRALDDACLDLPAVLRERLSPSQVLERFMDDGFAAWIARTLARTPEGRA